MQLCVSHYRKITKEYTFTLTKYNHVLISISCGELSPTDAIVSLQMLTSVTEGTAITISVDLSNVPRGGLEVDLVVTFSTTPGTASEYSKQKLLGRP